MNRCFKHHFKKNLLPALHSSFLFLGGNCKNWSRVLDAGIEAHVDDGQIVSQTLESHPSLGLLREEKKILFLSIVFYDFVVVVVTAAYSIPQLITCQLSQRSFPKGMTKPTEVWGNARLHT